MSDQDQLANPPLISPLRQDLYPEPNYFLETEEGRSLKDYLYILKRRKWWVILTFLAIFLSVCLYTFLRTPIYRSMATLQITQDNPAAQVSVEEKISQLSGGNALDEFKQTQHKILQSRSLALRVIKALNLQSHPDFRDILEDNPDKSEAEIENELKDRFLEKLEVSPIRNTSLVEIYFQSPDKEMAQRVVNTMADEFMSLSIDKRNESFSLVRKWLDRQLQEMSAKLQETQKKLYEFGWQTDIYTLDDKDNVIVQKFTDLSALLTKAQAERLAKEAQFKQIKEKGPDAPLIINHPLIAELRKELVAQQAKVSGMKKVFREGHPQLQAEMANLAEIQGRLQGEVRRLQESVKADFEAAKRTEELLQEAFATQKEEMAKLQKNLTQYQILKRDAKTNEQLYQALLARVKEANIASTMVPSNVAVIDPAELPSKPYKPKTLRDLALATFLGLSLAVGLALLMEQLDDSIQTTEELEHHCHLPSLGTLPLLGSNGSLSLKYGDEKANPEGWRSMTLIRRCHQSLASKEDLDLIMIKQPHSPASEAIRYTQTAIMLSMSSRPPGVIMVTSPSPSEGKTMVACNLALTFALSGHRTLLIDCDLRRPRVHSVFKFRRQPGLSNYLTGSVTVDEILRSAPEELPNLEIISAGPTPPNPATLLNSKEFKEFLKQMRQRFNHIIIDTPPVLGFSDGLIISRLTDGVLLVTKHKNTKKSAARLAQKVLGQVNAPILGAVLNGVDNYTHWGYYYHYKYYSK